MFIQVSENLLKLSKFFPEKLYVVGGYVRNQLLGLGLTDVDLCSSVDIQEVSKRLEGSEFSVKVKNLKMGALLISCGNESYEYTAFRKEVYDEGGAHCPKIVTRTDKIEEDAIRRDFTINAIYYCINTDKCVDLFHGIVDLSSKIIRCVSEPDQIFQNDGERILRLVRIAGELNFKIDKKTLESARKFVSNLKDLQGSRKFMEIEKILYCDKHFNYGRKCSKRALKLLNLLGVWQYLGVPVKRVNYDLALKCEDRMLGLIIDIVDSVQPACLEAFLEGFLKEQFGFNQSTSKKLIDNLSGYYNAMRGMNNKEFFFKYFEMWAVIEPILGCKSKRVQSKYDFFYKYIIEHGLIIKQSDLKIDENDIKKTFPEIDERHYDRILNNLLSKVFDGKLLNDKKSLIDEIEKNLQNF